MSVLEVVDKVNWDMVPNGESFDEIMECLDDSIPDKFKEDVVVIALKNHLIYENEETRRILENALDDAEE